MKDTKPDEPTNGDLFANQIGEVEGSSPPKPGHGLKAARRRAEAANKAAELTEDSSMPFGADQDERNRSTGAHSAGSAPDVKKAAEPTPRRQGDGLKAAQKRAQEAQENAEKRLSKWAEELREAPNEALRCALFTARNRNVKREQLKAYEVSSYGNSKVFYTGEELRQDDLDVWLQVLHLARLQELGTPIRFSPAQMKKDLKWPYGVKHTARLMTILTRLKATAVQFHSERLAKGVFLSLVRKFEYTEGFDTPGKRGDDEWTVELEPEIATLFGSGFYSTRLEWQQRMALPGNLAKWLHGFYASHSEPYALHAETLLKHAGSKVSTPGKARQMVKEALNELVTVGFLKEAHCDRSGKVTVERNKGLSKKTAT
ncbi:plasmid replication initiator TrfA [Pseudomonas sp. Irchel 3E13]|uniref:plasmid replication initiator TrfA n=1 Tax=Pseudomonas sp. Irchel 3E13 TaxID=2008975 RepID=UPI000BA4CB25|nr:plasmid replication initiator TrfA [Pseudomonas sp. Irchel 3E13]